MGIEAAFVGLAGPISKAMDDVAGYIDRSAQRDLAIAKNNQEMAINQYKVQVEQQRWKSQEELYKAQANKMNVEAENMGPIEMDRPTFEATYGSFLAPEAINNLFEDKDKLLFKKENIDGLNKMMGSKSAIQAQQVSQETKLKLEELGNKFKGSESEKERQLKEKLAEQEIRNSANISARKNASDIGEEARKTLTPLTDAKYGLQDLRESINSGDSESATKFAYRILDALAPGDRKTKEDVALAFGLSATSTIDQIKQNIRSIWNKEYLETNKKQALKTIDSLDSVLTKRLTENATNYYQQVKSHFDTTDIKATDDDIMKSAGMPIAARAYVDKSYKPQKIENTKIRQQKSPDMIYAKDPKTGSLKPVTNLDLVDKYKKMGVKFFKDASGKIPY